jgi:predicted dehydrogenase
MGRAHAQGVMNLNRQAADAGGGTGPTVQLHATDLNPQAREAFATQYPEATLHEDAEALLAGPAEPGDVVIVATPPSSHEALTRKGFASGRHVLCEKPLAWDESGALRMLEAARAAGRHLGDCSNRFLGSAPVERLRSLLAEQRLGNLYHVTWRARWPRARVGVEYAPATMGWALTQRINGGGVLMDWAPYDLATLFHILDPVAVEVVDAVTAQPQAHAELGEAFKDIEIDVEFHVLASLRCTLRDGSLVRVAFERSACAHGEALDEAHFAGTQAGASLSWVFAPSLTLYDDEAGKLRSTELTTPEDDASLPGIHHRPYAFMRRNLLGDAEAPALLDERAVFNFQVLRAIYTVAQSGRPTRIAFEGGSEAPVEAKSVGANGETWR